MGSNDLKYQIFYYLQALIAHPAYNPSTLLNDVKMLKTATTITFISGAVAPAGYSTVANSDFGGSILTTPGWGQISSSGPTSDVLLWTNYKVQSSSYCTSQNSQYNQPYDANSQICGNGLFTYTQSATCPGDSGGPMLSNNVVVGITSRRMTNLCATSLPDVFTKVGAYASWITAVIGYY